MANARTRLTGEKTGEAPTEELSIRFDARDRLRGEYDDATVAQLAGVDS